MGSTSGVWLVITRSSGHQYEPLLVLGTGQVGLLYWGGLCLNHIIDDNMFVY